MNGLNDLVRTEFADLGPDEILTKPPSALLGVSEDASAALANVGIKTIFDLALSNLFGDAEEIVAASGDATDAIAQLGRVPSDWLSDGVIDPTAAADKGIEILRGLDGNADTLKKALDVSTVRDLALWPPRLSAKRAVAKTFVPPPVGAEGLDSPDDLVPQTGRYATERLFYDTLVIDPAPAPAGAKELAGGGVQVDISAEAPGFAAVTTGAVLTFEQAWYGRGVALGQLLHSVALSPGESTRIALIDWSRRTSASATEQIGESQTLENTMTHGRAMSEVQHAVATEAQSGFSQSHGESTTESGGGGFGLDLGFMSIGGSGGASTTTTDAWSATSSSGRRDLQASMTQQVNDRTQQAASSVRNRRASIVREVSQTEHEEVSTRVVCNYNHMHALSVAYYEVVQVYKVTTKLVSAQPCLFVPFTLLDFSQRPIVDRFRDVLARAALSEDIRQMLVANRGMVRISATAPVNRFIGLIAPRPLLGVRMAALARTEGGAGGAGAAEGDDGGNGDGGSGAGTSRGGVAVGWPRGTIDPATAASAQWDRDQIVGAGVIVGRPVIRPFDSNLFFPAEVELLGFAVQDVQASAATIARTGGVSIATSGDPAGGIGLTAATPIADLDSISLTPSNAQPAAGRVVLQLAYLGRQFTIDVPISVVGTASQRIVTFARPPLEQGLVDHLTQNRLYYSQKVLESLSPGTVALLLGGYTYNGEALIGLVDSRPFARVGNYLVFKLNDRASENVKPHTPSFTEWLDGHGIAFDTPTADAKEIPLPSGGVFAEAVLGRSNSAEKLDVTRFWNWQDSPIPLQPPEIADISTGSRAEPENLLPGQLGQPLVNIVNPSALPDPTGLGPILGALQAGNMFRDMSGIAATQALAQAAQQASSQGAQQAQVQATSNMAIEAQKQVEMAKTALGFFQAMMGMPPTSAGSGANITGKGAMINQGRDMDTRGVGKQEGDTAGGAGTSGAGGGSTGGTGGGASGTAGSTPTADGRAAPMAGYEATAFDNAQGEPPRAVQNAIDSVSKTLASAAAAPAGARDAIDLVWPGVELLHQTTNDNCWATAAAMVEGWATRTSAPIRDTPAPADIEDAAARCNLEVEPPLSYSIDGFQSLLQYEGPLWVAGEQQFTGGGGIATPGFHAVVVVGMYGDGTPKGTFLYVFDPWDRGHGAPGRPGAHLGTHDAGSRYSISWEQFTAELETAVEVEPGWMWVRAMHAKGTDGRIPTTGARTNPVT
jgi:hypothetical protein